MIKNYLTIALRSMMRNKAYSAINIFGLAVGLSCCLLLALYIQDEVSYDRHHRDIDQLYQVTSIMGDESENKVMRTTSGPIVWGIKDELPEIAQVTRLVNPPGVAQNLIRYRDLAERRFKEIGVRKVMGATVTQILGMMSGEFVRLVFIAFFLAAPLAWFVINRWQEDFAFKAPLGAGIFVYAGLSTLFIAVLTVSFESIKAASRNPVHALRNE